MFTKTDKALLDRTALLLTKKAAGIQSIHPVWGATADSKKSKLEYDRLLRDARDLRALAKRMVPKDVVPQPELPLAARSK